MKRSIVAMLLFPLAAVAEVDIYGRYEQVGLPELHQTVEAKMDTGAYTSSLSAKDIETFKHDDKEWVRFRLAIEGVGDTVYEHQLTRFAQIKNRADTRSEDDDEDDRLSQRPVIMLTVCLGERLEQIEVNLTDRSDFNYPFLMGAKGLRAFNAAIDPARRFKAGKPRCRG